jgi:hypothetical protein
MTRSARGIELTAAGRVFLDRARLALAQEAAASAARRVAHPEVVLQAGEFGLLAGSASLWEMRAHHATAGGRVRIAKGVRVDAYRTSIPIGSSIGSPREPSSLPTARSCSRAMSAQYTSLTAS